MSVSDESISAVTSIRGRVATLWPYALAVAACVVTTLLCYPLVRYLALTNIVMLYLLAVLLVSVYAGRGAGVVATLLSVALFDVMFVPPRWSFVVDDVQYLLTFAVMLAVALITTSLTAGLKQQVQLTAQREHDARSLYATARELAGALSATQTSESIARAAQTLLHADAALLLPDDKVCLRNATESSSGLTSVITTLPAWIDTRAANAVYVGDRTGHRSVDLGGLSGEDPSVHYLPLRAPMRVRGVLAVRGQVVAADRAKLDALASLSAIAVERLHYVDVAQRTQLQMNTERLRHSLLAAVSHDLRTPLTALVGLADTLTLPSAALNSTALATAEAIRDQARELSTLVGNLLDMARLQTGRVTLRREWQPLEEVIGASIEHLRTRLSAHPVRVNLAKDLPLVNIDAVLMERVFCNLLDNAAKYSSEGSPITIDATPQGDQILIAVVDSGPGVASKDAARIFAVFERAAPESASAGAGLGLSICRSIVEAHGGELRCVEQPVGARFEFTLPMGEPPVIDEAAVLRPVQSTS
ncbi:MAG: DUF4118 domain-containing protein [Gammaproteobacteria bacterium]